MDCTDKYYNFQPSTNDHSKHVVYYKSEALQLTPPPPPLLMWHTIFNQAFCISQWILKGEAKAKSAWSPVLGSLRYEEAHLTHVLAVTKET